MTMYGADIHALRNFARQVEQRGQGFEQTRLRLAGLIENLAWKGADRDEFVRNWNNQHAGLLANMIEDLDRAAHEARVAARRQERTSEDDR